MNTKHLHVIVRFDLKEGELDTLVWLIRDFFGQEVSRFPGFISAKIHQNEEGTVLINYATWESAASFQQFVMKLASVFADCEEDPSVSSNPR